MSKVGIIAIARNEQLYIREWVDHHFALGFDGIIVADNDDNFLLPGVIERSNLTFLDYTGPHTQSEVYTELYQRYRTQYDWLLFIDLDEFVMCDTPIPDFLDSFNSDVVRISCKHFSDGDMLDTDGDFRVIERFTEPYYTQLDTFAKSFINTRVELIDRKVYGHGIYDKSLDARNALGDPCENTNPHTTRIVHQRCWLNHYPTKTIGEYIRQKYNRGGINNNPGRYKEWQKYFFRTNRKTQEKIDYANTLINNRTN